MQTVTDDDSIPSPAPRRRLDARTRRESILAAARSAFAHAAYPAVSVADIAADAGVSEALVHRYFDGKAGLYGEVVTSAVAELRAAQRAANDALPQGTPARDRVRVSLEVYLDHISAHPPGWSAPFLHAGNDPQSVLELRREIRLDYVRLLRAMLAPRRDLRFDYALHGYFGMLDAACLTWVERGCPPRQRAPLIEAALGALEGAIGDWG